MLRRIVNYSPSQLNLDPSLICPPFLLPTSLLLINLFSAHLRYYQPGKKKWGIVLIHLGVVLLLLGQLLTDALSSESMMHIREGASKNYSEAAMTYELAVVDTTDPQSDKVVAIPSRLLARQGQVTHVDLPFVRVEHGRKLVATPASGTGEVLLDVDGEAPGRLPATFRLLPSAIRLQG